MARTGQTLLAVLVSEIVAWLCLCGILDHMENRHPYPDALQPPDPNIRIRPVRRTDIVGLMDCWPERGYAALESMVLRAQKLAEQGRGLGVVVVDDDNRVIKAYGQLTLWPNCGEISDLIVAAAYRGQKLGTTLVQYLMRAAREMHVDCVEIGAALSNPRALVLYRRLGFRDSHEVMIDLGKGKEPVLYLRLKFQRYRL